MRAFSVRSGDVELAAIDVGVGDPIVWIHGSGVAACGWAPQIDAFAATHRCVSFDHRGVGRSPRGAQRITIDGLVGDALAVLDAAQVERAHVVGHSLGGLVALRLARVAPARVRSLGLWCTFASGAVPTRLTWPIVWLGARSVMGTQAMRRRAFGAMIFSRAEQARPDLDAELARLGGIFGRDLGDGPSVAREQVMAMRGEDETPYLADLSVPTQVLSADEDLIATRSAGEALAAGVTGAEFVAFSDAGHALPLTRTAEVNARYRAFLERVSREG
jgi:aminoacrylate hydrolase